MLKWIKLLFNAYTEWNCFNTVCQIFKENHITDNIINSDKNFLLYFAKKYPYPPHPSI